MDLAKNEDFLMHSFSSSTSSCCSTPVHTTLPNSPIRKSSPIRIRFRLRRFILPFALISLVLLVLFLFRNSAKLLIFWIERQNLWCVFVVFLCLYVVVAFPITVGYLVLIVSSGYIFGLKFGLLTTILGANLGVFVAHIVLKSIKNKLPLHRLINNETGRAIMRVISGPRAFKVVLFTRLTPIPFGVQNTIFGMSSVNFKSYHTATLLGLLPAQTINVYLGSKLRTIQEVFQDHSTALAGYGVFVVEVLVGAALMIWVLQKARHELSAALLTNLEADEKLLIEIA